MDVEEPCYDLDELARANWHVHGFFSGCEEMTLPAIVSGAEAAGLHTVAITDHHGVSWDEDVAGFARKLRAEFEGIETQVRFLFGAELSAFGVGKFLDPIEVNRQLDYRLYACNHYHLGGWEHPEDRSPRGYAEHALAVVRSLLPTGRADCIAHPFEMEPVHNVLPDHHAATRAITDQELGDVLELGRRQGVAWGLNAQVLGDDPELSRRLWEIGREVGVTFRLGTDAHELVHLDPHPFLPMLKALLDGKE